MYGSPAGVQVHAGQWQHDALHQAEAHRRHRVDRDFERDLVRSRENQHRLVAVATIILALGGLVLI